MRSWRTSMAAVAVVGLALLAGCSDDGGGDDAPGTTLEARTATTPATSPPTSAATTTSGAPSTTTTTEAAPPTSGAALVPGQPCTPGSSPDCIDPYGDGGWVYLLGGAECMASPIGGSMCADLDGDGYAGYPDSG